MYTQIYTTTVVQGGVFYMLQYFKTILPSVLKAFDLLNKMRYILWVVALLEGCDVTNNGVRPLYVRGLSDQCCMKQKLWIYIVEIFPTSTLDFIDQLHLLYRNEWINNFINVSKSSSWPQVAY